MFQLIKVILLLFVLVWSATEAGAVVDTAGYQMTMEPGPIPRQTLLHQNPDSILQAHPMLSQESRYVAIERLRIMNNKTIDFYLLLTMLLILGVIRYANPRYFSNLWKAFINPAGTARQLKDQLEAASFQGLLMNLFFTISCGAYLYYVLRLFVPGVAGSVNSSFLLLMVIGGLLLIYLVKYFVMKFSGWAFRLEGITDNYIFNVFLINKVMAILLLPFTLVMAFAAPGLAGPAFVVSVILVCVLLISRYTRSWVVFGSFFQFSKFHFFTYLCASELLPLALLMKLLVRSLNI